MFKFATKELSQDAFISWCINWINYKEHKLYNLGKEFLNMLITNDNGKRKFELNETFGQRYMIYNCFKIDVDKYYTGKMNLRLQAGGIKLTDKTSIWTPIFYSNSFSKWQNTIDNKSETIVETSNKDIDLRTANRYRYVFARRRDSFNDIYFEFLGVFYLDTKETKEEKRIWKRYNFNDKKITLNVKELEKELDLKFKK